MKERLLAAARFLWSHKLWWLVPMAAVLALFLALVWYVAQGPQTPFVYTLF